MKDNRDVRSSPPDVRDELNTEVQDDRNKPGWDFVAEDFEGKFIVFNKHNCIVKKKSVKKTMYVSYKYSSLCSCSNTVDARVKKNCTHEWNTFYK